MYSWEHVKEAVERNEDAQLEHSLAELEVSEGHVARDYYPMQRARPYLEVLGGMIMGLYASLMSIAFNYLLFVWILHVNFDR